MPDDSRLRLGTRASRLALAQSRQVADALEAAHAGLRVELVPIRTRGDRTSGDLRAVGGKGLFTAELEAGLLDGSLDLAVHSLKDLPVERPDGLEIAATPARADPRDCLVGVDEGGLDALGAGARVLTGSARRRGQLLQHRPDLRVEPVRGNVDTRIERWRAGDAEAVVLAMAGLQRLELRELPLAPLDPEVVVPAPGQGTLAVETRRGGRVAALCQVIDDAAAARQAMAERRVIAAFGGDCFLPLGAWAEASAEGTVRLVAWLGTPDGTAHCAAEAVADEPQEAARRCVEELLAGGAASVLEALDR